MTVTQRDELLQEFRVAVLDVVQVEHNVVAHLQPEVDLFDLLGRGGVVGFGGVERGHGVTQSGAVHFHKDKPQPARHVLHESRFTVTGRGYEQKHTHLVGPLVRSHTPHLFGQVIADHRKIDLVDQLVANERRHDFGRVLV